MLSRAFHHPLLTLAGAEGLLLLMSSFLCAAIGEGRYHPVFAGDPWRALPFWQRGLCLALLLGAFEVTLLACARGRYGIEFPVGVREIQSWFRRG